MQEPEPQAPPLLADLIKAVTDRYDSTQRGISAGDIIAELGYTAPARALDWEGHLVPVTLVAVRHELVRMAARMKVRSHILKGARRYTRP